MSYKATVFRVMIASPSDVNQERGIVRELLAEWNVINSQTTNKVLLPVAWETHSSPSMSSPAQAVLNMQVLKDCDLLIGIFWTRLGTKTEAFESGTVEEIQTHLAAAKDAMIYFSQAPVVPESLDVDQYSALKLFRDTCKGFGLYETYVDANDFRNKFFRQLTLKIQGDDAFKTEEKAPSASPFQLPVIAQEVKGLLARGSKEADAILEECAKSSDGTIIHAKYLGGEAIQTNEKNMISDDSARSLAMWVGALQELIERELIADVGSAGEIFRITRKGYGYYDAYLKA